MFSKLLVPLDGSPLAERALPYAEALARASGARVLLVRAALARIFPGADPTRPQVRAVDEAEAYLASVAASLTARHVDVEAAVPYGGAAEAILDEIRLRHADLVVMTTHGRTGLKRLIYGSVAGAVLRHGNIPLLLVRAGAAESKAEEQIGSPEGEDDDGPDGPPMTVTLTPDDAVLVRTALETLRQTVSAHEHLHERIRRLLDRLPAEGTVENGGSLAPLYSVSP